MCSLTGNDYEDSIECMEPKKSETLIGAMCKKCKEKKGDVILRVKDVYCRFCFLESFTHKFRATLGKSKMIRPNDHVLLAVSGSQSSLAMLQLVKEGCEITSPKRLQCVPHVIYIDEGAALGHDGKFRNDTLKSIVRLLKTYGIPGYVTTLDRSLENNSELPICYDVNEIDNSVLNEERDFKIKELFVQLKTLTSKEDLLQKLRSNLLLKVAASLKCSKIFVGDSSTDLAVKIMSNLSLGRGAHLSLDVGFCDSRNSAIHIIRPMRDLSKREIAYYNVFKNIESIYFPSFTTKADPFSCIQRLTEKFVVDLQDEFPSTVSTIFRTADKLSVEGVGTEEVVCILCQAPLDTSKRSPSSLQATEFSQIVSTSQLTTEQTVPEKNVSVCCEAGSGSESSPSEGTGTITQQCACGSKDKTQSLEYGQIKSYLCYGCRLIVKEMGNLDLLPAEVIQTAKAEIMQTQLRNEIQDFLL